ncbi:hypothetical protein [Actinoplanes aureus]|uniref:Uncharacterized protein n=1 Tax=Actinoplanes aureus TaxID=2792083 RepID=A0A931CJ80_9ACTN|nr:hypothetical protein [Actinoplanes aureus]MBG0565915.1 hypothetical protein [Actinoplanes aureus]
MTAAQWPPADPALERAYKRLLRAYPPGYRRRHGREIVTTLLEMAEPGQRRPGRAETWHLIGSGIRQRFRLPAGRPLAWALAVLALLIGGSIGAAAGSWAAERTFAALPGPSAAEDMHQLVAGGAGQQASLTSHGGSRWWGPTMLGTVELGAADGWDAEQARQRLIADGWQVSVMKHPSGSAAVLDENGQTTAMRVDGDAFTAERDGLTLDVDGWNSPQAGTISTQLWASGNASLLPLIVLGGLAGMVVGWLFAAALVQRLRHSDPARVRTAALLGTAAALVLSVPAAAFYGNVVRAFEKYGNEGPTFTVHSALTPGPYWPSGPGWLTAAMFGAGVLLAAALVLVSWGRPVAATASRPVTS